MNKKHRKRQIRKNRIWKHFLYWCDFAKWPPCINSRIVEDYDPEKWRKAFETLQERGGASLTNEELINVKPIIDGQRSKEITLNGLATESMEFWAQGRGWIIPWVDTLNRGVSDRLTKVAILRTIRTMQGGIKGKYNPWAVIDFFKRHPGIKEETKQYYFSVKAQKPLTISKTELVYRMNLQDKITEDIKFSMKNGEVTRLGVLRQLKNTMMNASLAKGNVKTPLSDNEVLNIIRKQIVQREDSISQFTKGNRNDLVEKENNELTVLTAYLPVSLTENEVDQIVQKSIIDTGALTRKDTGKFMKRAMELAENRIDSKTLVEKYIAFCEAGQQIVTLTPVE